MVYLLFAFIITYIITHIIASIVQSKLEDLDFEDDGEML